MNESNPIDRRQFLVKTGRIGMGIAGGVGMAELLSYQTGIGLRDAVNAAILGVEYGPDIAFAIGNNPTEFKETVDLWIKPDLDYLKAPFFKEPFSYQRDARNTVLAFGDSNMVGARGNDQSNSPVDLFKDKLKGNIGEWKVLNFAKSGFTTQMVVDKQLHSREAREVFENTEFCDVWVNAGGNDMGNVAFTREEVMEVQKLSIDPWANPEILFKYASRLKDNLRQFGNNFSGLLNALDNEAQGKIKHLAIMSVPDFSRAPSITTQEIGAESYSIPLHNPYLRDLVGNISIRMNNIMFGVTEKFQENKGVRIVGIDTYHWSMSKFGKDQHFTQEADYAIAEDAFRKVQFTN